MNRNELIPAIAEKSGLSRKDAGRALDAFTEIVREALAKGDNVKMQGFGTFGVKERAAHSVLNPRTRVRVEIAPSRIPFFKAGKFLKDALN